MAKILNIKPNFKGMGVYTEAPVAYERKEHGKFILDDNLSQRDRRYLYDVMGLKSYFIEVEPEARSKKTTKKPFSGS